MARLTFSNVPTAGGGVISGDISIGAGSPFGAGGKYESQIAGIKAEIAKKPVGYYDPPPLTLWKENNPRIQAELDADPAVKKAQERLHGLLQQQQTYRHQRFTSEGERLVFQQLIDREYKIINDIRLRITTEKNMSVIQAQQEQKAREDDLERKLEIELAVQQALEKQVINQRPKPESEPTPVSSTISILPIILIPVVLIGILLFLRRRA